MPSTSLPPRSLLPVFAIATLLHLGTPLAFAQAPAIPSQEVQFARGASGASVEGNITGDGVLDYRLTARAGQTMDVTLEAGTPSIDFNVMPPGDGKPLYVGSMSEGKSFSGTLPTDGEYTVRLYLMGNARDTGLKVPYTIKFAIGGATLAAGTSGDFDQSLSLQGITFRVMTSVDDSGKTRLTVTPEGLELDNSRQELTIEGTVTGAEVADLNADGSPEIYVFTRAGGGSGNGEGNLHGWAANKKRSLSEIYLPEPAPDDPNFAGYQGGDEFAVVEQIIGRRFPVGDKTRQLQYKLKAGEAGWVLELDRTVEY